MGEEAEEESRRSRKAGSEGEESERGDREQASEGTVPCRFPLSLSSVMLFCLVLPPSSCDVFIWHSVVVVYSRVLLLTFFDMGDEEHV